VLAEGDCVTCPYCLDGLLPVEWTDAEPDWAVCLCAAGQALRVASNQGKATVPRWRLWAARWGVDPARVYLLEAIYTPQELAAVGLAVSGPVSVEAALLAAGRKRR
jgi:hypothetical protein